MTNKTNERAAALRRAALRRSGASGVHRHTVNRSAEKRRCIRASVREW